MRSTWGDIYWPIFLSIVSVLFLVPETIALITNHANDLSEYCWRQLSVTKAFVIGPHTFAWYSSFVAWILAVILLTFHIWFRAG